MNTVPYMFLNFYLVKNHNIAKNSMATKAREKISTDLEYCGKNYFMSIDIGVKGVAPFYG